MRCSNCGVENPDRAKFCIECASPFAQRCPACGAENPPRAKFCSQCSTPIAGQDGGARNPPKSDGSAIVVTDAIEASVAEGERKTVTALFADIKGSMELMEDLDPEEARAIVDPALRLMIDAAHRYDGYIVQSTGDGIFALFGAPVAHEDHPQRALYAALRMQEEMRRYAERLRADKGINLQVRVGVNTGEVVVRSIQTGDGHAEYTPIGHSTGLAARLQTLANPGAVVIGESLRRLAEGYFQLKPLGPARIKGVNEPVELFEVTGLGPLRTRLQKCGPARAHAIRRPPGGDRPDEARAGADQGWTWSGRRGDGRAGRRQVAPVLRVQGGCAKRMPGAGGLLGLARQGLGLPAGNRPAQSYFGSFPEDDDRATAREGDRQEL